MSIYRRLNPRLLVQAGLGLGLLHWANMSNIYISNNSHAKWKPKEVTIGIKYVLAGNLWYSNPYCNCYLQNKFTMLENGSFNVFYIGSGALICYGIISHVKLLVVFERYRARLLPLFKQQFSVFKQHYTNRPLIFPTYWIEETYLFPLTVCINLAAWLKPHLSPSFLC